jgi:type IV pilus assembly protein PilC
MPSAFVVQQPHAVPTPRRGFSLSLRVSQKQLTEFTREFSTLLDAGLPVVRSLDILHEQIPGGLLKSAVATVKDDVEGGSSLSEALSKHPAVFDKLYVNMVRAGEAGGVLDEIFERIADYREKAQRLQQKIFGALLYPAAVVTIAGTILAGIMIFIIPKFEQMFLELDIGEMPVMTKLLMATANTCVHFWYLLVFAPVLAYFGIQFLGKTQTGRRHIDRAKLQLPIFGIIVSKSSVSRFCRTLGTLTQSGVPILEALSILQNATGNQVLADAVGTVHASIKEGDSIYEPMRHSGCFDHLVVNMVHVGEETGQLDKMLIKIADNYDNQVDAMVGAMMSLLEPILIVTMGLAVGFIVIGLFLPLIKLMEGISGGAH